MRFFVIFALFFCNIDKMDACVFCRQETLENQSVFQSNYFNVLVDYAPRMKGHLLVVPKRHLAKAHELSTEEWAELSFVIPKIVECFSTVLHTDQYLLVEKNGVQAFQSVPHVHFHVLPVTTQTWAEIFKLPEQLSREDLEKEVASFRLYFSF